MKIAFLTSSRADFGIYLPLIKALNDEDSMEARLIVFGTHLSKTHGNTISEIRKEGFIIDHEVETVMPGDDPASIAGSMALTSAKFTSIWEKEKQNYDLVFCLGDRYEMFAAVSASVPFLIPFAHLHGGETTLGAIDNRFRHCLTHFSNLHFVSTQAYAERVRSLTGSDKNIFNVGALGLDNLSSFPLLDSKQMKERFKIDFSIPTILVTYHPETTGEGIDQQGGLNLLNSIGEFKDFQVVITMPNADTHSGLLRKAYQELESVEPRVKTIENFGTQGYFSAMNLSRVIVGNSSSGIIEAASFKKYVVNIGERQGGRAVSENIIQTSNNTSGITEGVKLAIAKGEFTGKNIYYNGGAVQKIMEVLRKWK